MRIDALNADTVPSQQLSETPDLLKILFRGTKADLGIIERIRSQGHPKLESFWRETIGIADHGHLLGSGNGYQKLRRSSRIRLKGDGLPGVDASYLHKLPEITTTSFSSVSIDVSLLDLFSLDRIHDPRSIDLFAGPLVVVHKSPPAMKSRISVAISENGGVFNETFYGYSPQGYSDASTLVRYLALVLGSTLVVWMALITSGEFGFEREVIEKATLDRIPLPDFRKFKSSQRAEIRTLFRKLQAGTVSWNDVDEWVARLYGLGPRDLQVISDTLEFNLPFSENKRRAQEIPTDAERDRFCVVLSSELSPWCERLGSKIVVHQFPQHAISPWCGISVRTSDLKDPETIPAQEWEGLLRAADEAAASEILLRNGSNGLLIGRLAQRRYWSETQARLLAQHIVWSHLDLLKGRGEA
jgi:hypothetical protein